MVAGPPFADVADAQSMLLCKKETQIAGSEMSLKPSKWPKAC